MLHFYGRQVPNLRVNSDVDKYLYIDIDNADLSAFDALILPPTATYIITIRPLRDFDSYIERGYFNILHVSRPSEITEALINRFISQEYSENHLKILSQRVTELYLSTGSVIGDLSQALQALQDDELDTFVGIMSVNVPNFLNVMDEINKMAIFCKSVHSVEDSYTDTVKKAGKLEEALSAAELYRGQYEALRAESALFTVEKQELQDKIESLTAQINARTITSTEIRNSAEFLAVQARLESVIAERNEIKQEFDNYKQDMSETAAAVDGNGLMELNRQLREEIRKLKERKPSDIVADKLPIFMDSTTLNAECILCFREIRPTVYIDSLIQWLNSSLRIYSKSKGKSYLILVIDPLASHFDEHKYLKHGWCVSKITEDMSVLVVPPTRFDVLKSTYHIESYDVLICIDRCHTMTPVVDMKRAKVFNLINSCSDIQDFGLDGTRCIAFMDKVPAGVKSSDITPKYHIPTWDESLCTTDIAQRAAKHSKDGVFIDILKECGVYWK